MKTNYRGALNEKPPSTWKTGVVRSRAAANNKVSDTVDLSKIHLSEQMQKPLQLSKNFNSLMDRWRTEKMHRKGFTKADAAKSRRRFLKNNISDEYYKPLPVFSSSTSIFSKYSDSLRVYFSLTEQLIWVSIALTLMAQFMV